MEYAEAIDWLYGTQNFGIKLGLESPRRLLKEFRAFPADGVKVVHVAGTNGKGSVCAMVDAMARCSGIRTGLFTSPHLVDYAERMQVCGEMISAQCCAELLSEVRELCEKLDTHPTFFEITLAVAMRWFKECGCEWIILETGMGGRLDATTAVPADVCVITPIGMDHTQHLGSTLGEIAGEKAGIFLEGVPAFSSPQMPEARCVLEEKARAQRTRLEFIEQPLEGFEIALLGFHQKQNAALALAACRSLGLPMHSAFLKEALAKVSWPGRFECFVSEGIDVILDGAHNPHAARVLRKTWLEHRGEKQGTLIFGAVESKDVGGIFQQLLGLTKRVFLCQVSTERGLSTEELRKFFVGEGEPECFESFENAMLEARKYGEPILITGSLFLVGEARAYLLGGEFQSSTQ